jgi:hypothetical protein
MLLKVGQEKLPEVGDNLTGQNEDGSSKILQNVGILPQHYIASQPRWP